MEGKRGGSSMLDEDPDIRREAEALAGGTGTAGDTRATGVMRRMARRSLVLNVVSQSHRPSEETKALVRTAGGLPALREMTRLFYEKAFEDSRLDTFIRSRDDPHSERFATWICEKFGLGQPWTTERRSREVCPFHAHGHRIHGAHDRSSAHFAAWHSPKRPESKWGDHFKLDDCRVWMRLHFWACREAGMFARSPEFMDYYIKFIGHFVSVYERTAPPFARESARWSEDSPNIRRYVENGRVMSDVLGLGYEEAVAQLPESERGYTGSSAANLRWPYGHA